MKACYGNPPKGVDLDKLSGLLIVIEGSDSSGRSTQINLLSSWLEEKGYAVIRTGLSRSKLFGPALERAKRGNVLSPRTRSLFYATDFFDQMESVIVPALFSGHIVLADRYIYTLIARDIVRGTNPDWLDSLYSMAIIPDAVYFLMVPARYLAERTLSVYQKLDYWESGMDTRTASDWYDNFIRYQNKLRNEYKNSQDKYQFEILNGNRSIRNIQRNLQSRVEMLLQKY